MKANTLIALLFVIFFPIHAQIPSNLPQKGLITLPDNGNQHIIDSFNNAKYSIKMCIYHLRVNQYLKLIITAKQRGVKIEIITQKSSFYPPPFDLKASEKAIEKLQENGIEVNFLTDHSYGLMHSNYLIIDDQYALVMTYSLDHFNFNSRNFGLIVTKPETINILKTIFANDFTQKSHDNDNNVQHYSDHGVILGPKGQRQWFYDLITCATNSIYIYTQDFTDPQMGRILSFMAKRGIKVKVLITPSPFGQVDMNVINHKMLQDMGGEVKLIPKDEHYIHAKVILIDGETSFGKAYIGSCNLCTMALDSNRELGILTTDTVHIDQLLKVFNKDWEYEKHP